MPSQPLTRRVFRSCACCGRPGQRGTTIAGYRRVTRPKQQRYGLPDFAFIDMGDFAGATLKYLRQHPIKRLTLAGGFGKFCKLADGSLDLHSGRSQVNLGALSHWAGEYGASALTQRLIKEANTANEVLSVAQQHNVPLAQVVATKAQRVALEEVNGKVAIEVLVYDRDGRMVAGTGFN